MPVLGLIFLRHAFNRFLKAKDEIEKTLPVHTKRGRRAVTKRDFEAKSAIYLPENARYDFLTSLPEDSDIGQAIDDAMKSIEEEYQNLLGVLPKNYSLFSKDLLRELLRIFNKEVLQKAEGDLFGKIYEYFLNKFAMTSAQEGGEFFTPFSLVNTIVNVIEPDFGTLLDPATGSAGMFVQTGYFIESEGLRSAENVTFYGQEKADTNTKLAKMNLAVHGLEGNILEGNTFYEDKHNLFGKCDFVMANPPFNVDGVDKSKDIVKKDPRLPFGLPKNDNANYLWIQYFYSYLKPTGRAGFVMASSASDAGHSEKDIREKLVKSGAVDVMIAIGNNFFYTRSLPCALWFFDRGKETSPPAPLLSGEGSSKKITVEFNLPKPLLEKARNLRKNQTKAEEYLWQLLRNRQLYNLKFRRQHPLKANYVLDFYCAEAKLAIELDGIIHDSKDQKEYDNLRTEVIKNYDIEIIRFKNEEIFNYIEKVLYKISEAASNRISAYSALLKATSPPAPLLSGEGS